MTASAPFRSLLEAHGTDAMSFAALDASMHLWSDSGTRTVVAFADTGSAWVGASGPVAAPGELGASAARFVDAARATGRRASFFATERAGVPGFARLLLGEQPVFVPTAWLAGLARRRRLREQLRRARAKGVRVRRVHPGELRAGTPLRAEVEALCATWLASRQMPPMGFLVTLAPFHLAEEHLYFVAEREGHVVELLSAVPIYARRGWLVRDAVRDPRAPNGTTELVLARLMEEVAPTSDFVTLGLTPLSGATATWLRVLAWLARPLFDFHGLRAFRARLHPDRWDPVWMLYPDGESRRLHLLEALRAFARGSLLRFGARLVARWWRR